MSLTGKLIHFHRFYQWPWLLQHEGIRQADGRRHRFSTTPRAAYTAGISVETSRYGKTALWPLPFVRWIPTCRNSLCATTDKYISCVCVCFGEGGARTWLLVCKCSGFLTSTGDKWALFAFCESQWKSISPLSQDWGLAHRRPAMMCLFSTAFVSGMRCDRM